MIDPITIEKIKSAADIVDVVGEFVTLRKSGANYKGLCPFHAEKTPSFFVSPSRGTCHCFGCGKGGTPVSFIMEHEQMTYPEALRWLAARYHIEIRERELTDEEKLAQSERESMYIVNAWAAQYFQDTLHNHPDGEAIGMQYLRSRNIRDDIIQKFMLGYDLSDRTALGRTAVKKGYKDEFLVKTGICYKNERGELIDRYAGRVIFPWVGVNGKVVGFGGRKLDAATKGVQQKYVNSPDSEIYHKDHELYGIYQAKKAIAREDHVYMVEGYTDVISMHQCGIENVVANSGTALSVHQIHMLRRFTTHITLLYDGDEAGVHAALRGTDMLLSEGMNVKVLLFPDGDDPDSFARKHSVEAFRDYIKEHQTDFIQFKTDVLLNGVTDPSQRAEAINSIVRSISLVPNQILRDTYLHDCAQRLKMNEATLINTMNGFIRNDRQQQARTTTVVEAQERTEPEAEEPTTTVQTTPVKADNAVEEMLIQHVIKHGEAIIYRDVEDSEGRTYTLTVAQYMQMNLEADELRFGNELYNAVLQEAAEHGSAAGFKAEQHFLHHPDIRISRLADRLSTDKYLFAGRKKESSEHLKEEDLQRERDEAEEKMRLKTEHLLLDFRRDHVEKMLKKVMKEIRENTDETLTNQLMARYKDLQMLRNALAKKLGSEVVV